MKAKINTNDFNRIVDATKQFADKNTVMTIYNFIRLEFSAADSSVTAIATDGYRISIEHSVCDCDEDFTAYINPATRLPRGMEAIIELEKADLIIRCGDFIFGCQQIDGDFLDWEHVLPKDEVIFRIGFNGNYLLSALQSAKVSLGKSFRQPVVLEFRGEERPIILRTNKNDVKMVLPVRTINR